MHFNRENWLGILNDHDGFLPVEIEAVPEGTVLPSRNVLVQLINTDPKYFWATSFFETCLLRAVWYPTTIGTISWLCKQIFRDALARTSDNPQVLRHMLHDYGARGVSSQQSAALGGLAHLVNFSQSDTVPGILAAKQTSALIPLCHPLPLSGVDVELTPTARGYQIEARVRTTAQTGVEMEALTAVAVAALTVYDMVKAVDKTMVIGDVKLMFKSGGRSGTFRRR